MSTAPHPGSEIVVIGGYWEGRRGRVVRPSFGDGALLDVVLSDNGEDTGTVRAIHPRYLASAEQVPAPAPAPAQPLDSNLLLLLAERAAREPLEAEGGPPLEPWLASLGDGERAALVVFDRVVARIGTDLRDRAKLSH